MSAGGHPEAAGYEAAEAALTAALERARAEGEAAGAARAIAVVEGRLASVSQHDKYMRAVWGSHDKDREVEICVLERVLILMRGGESA